MSTRFQFERNFINAGKTLLANAAPQVIGFFDNAEKQNSRIEVGFTVVSAGADSRWIQNLNAVYYRSDYVGTWTVDVVTRYDDNNHHSHVSNVRAVFGSQWDAIDSNLNANYEVQHVWEVERGEFVRDEDTDEMITPLRFQVPFSLKPW